MSVTEVRQRTAVAGSLWVQRRFYVYELLLTKEKFYKGARGYVCMRTGTGPRAWIVLLYRGSCSRIMDHEVALPLRALRRGDGMDVFVTVREIDVLYIQIFSISLCPLEVTQSIPHFSVFVIIFTSSCAKLCIFIKAH